MKLEDDFLTDYYQKKHLFLGKSVIADLTWDDVISNINMCLINQSQIKVTENFGMVLHDTFIDRLKTLPLFAMTLHDFFEIRTSTHYYISFSELSKTFGKHNDSSCVFLYQAIGETEVTVWDEGEHVYKMKKHDIIYIPRNMDHSTKPLTPRVNISFGIDYEN